MSKQHLIDNLMLIRAIATAAVLATGSSALAGDWNVSPSTYSHSPETGRRTAQYQPKVASIRPPAQAVIRSGYRQVRDSLNVGGISDNSHYVERFGEPVQPYGEWRFPYRPYSSPYQAWGPPVPHSLHLGNQFGGVGGYGAGYGRRGGGYDGGGYGGHRPVDPGFGMRPDDDRRRRGIDPRRIPFPATPDRWQPWHDGGYPTLPRDYYQTAPEPWWPSRPRRRPAEER